MDCRLLNEKTPSFTVNDEKEFYHCFSSGEHGNIFDFIIKTENLGFGEAVKLLAKKAGLKEFMFSKQDIIFEIKKKNPRDIYFLENVAGILGTAITIPQIKLAWKNYKNIIVCFDGDQSGYLASYRAAEKIFINAVPGKDAFIIILKDNLDPDDFINKYKLDGLNELIRTKKSFRFYF